MLKIYQKKKATMIMWIRVGNVAYCGLGIVARYRPARTGYVNEKLLKYYPKLLTAFEK